MTRFCYDTRIWPTNNISERGLRPVKTQQKISGRLTSEHVTQDRLDIRSYIDTARKHSGRHGRPAQRHDRDAVEPAGPSGCLTTIGARHQTQTGECLPMAVGRPPSAAYQAQSREVYLECDMDRSRLEAMGKSGPGAISI